MQDKGHHQPTQSGKSSSSRSLLKHLLLTKDFSIMMFIFCSFIAHKSISLYVLQPHQRFYFIERKKRVESWSWDVWEVGSILGICAIFDQSFFTIPSQFIERYLSSNSTKISDEIVECFLLSFTGKKLFLVWYSQKVRIRARKNEFIKKKLFSFFIYT